MSRPSGFLHWIFPAMLGLVALTVLLSSRDLSLTYSGLAMRSEEVQHPVIVWSQRLLSLFLLAVTVERVVSHFVSRRHLPSPMLVLVFVTFWLGTVGFPAVFGSHPRLAHEYLYSLAIGFAAALAGPQDFDKAVVTARNALFAFLLAGVLLIPLNHAMVLDTSYTKGVLSALPRFSGLAPHPITLAMFAQIGLLCLWCRPFRSGWLTALAWLLGGAALLLAQSKNAWAGFVLCALCMLAVRNGPGLWRRVGDPRQGALGELVCIVVIVTVLALTGWFLVGDVAAQTAGFLDTAEGAQLMTLTGRDRIWAIAMEEWRMSPVFGYGPELWDTDYRASIGMPNATSGHNQFMDALARSGSTGAAALVLYAVVLLVLSVRYARTTGGLSLALFLALALRSVSEVPLLLLGYGTELFGHLLLIIALASSAAAGTQAAPAARARPVYGGVAP
ncbi:MAG TPA: O-antigen ligase family protein [Ramlibacter sp.]|nr:O-antigen ligase family protein [Ramlibacter sp.]